MKFESQPTYNQIEQYELPPDEGWQHLEDLPQDLYDIVTLHALAGAEGDSIDETAVPSLSLEEAYDIYDDWLRNDQQLLVGRDEDGRIEGMISYYLQPQQAPFMESVAVYPEAQQSGLGMQLIAEAIREITSTTDAEYVVAQAQERVAKIYERKLGALAVTQANNLVTVRVYIERE